MSKITLEITEVVNGLTINETPITLQGDLLAAASTSATAVSFTPAGGIAATNVQTALAELDTEKLNLTGGTMTGMLHIPDNNKIGIGTGGYGNPDLEIIHRGGNSYITEVGTGGLFITTNGPAISLASTVNDLALSATFVPGGAVTINDTYRARFTTNSTGSELNGQVNLVPATFPAAPTVEAGLNVAGLVEFDSLSGTGAVAITDILDADDMSGASATTLSTSESIKAYVDNQVAGKDNTDEITEGSTNLYFTNARADARIAENLIDEDGFGTNSATRAPSQQSVKAYVAAQTANIQGNITEVATGNGLIGGGTNGDLTVAVDTNLVALTSNTLSMNNKTLNTPVLNSPDINGGTMDGVTIGETIRSTGKFTTLDTTNGIVFVDASATGTASANTLDAYEEGTWTPVIRDAETGGNAATMLAATGHYTLIGNQCTLVARLINIDPADGSPSAPTGANTIYITGLPFAPANLPTGVRHIGSMESTAITYENSIQPRVLEDANFIVISNSQNNGSLSTLDFNAINTSAADIFLQVTYTV